MTNDNRVPAGSPEGGQWAAGSNPEPDAVSLPSSEENFSVATWDVHDPHVIERHDGSRTLCALMNDKATPLDRALAAQRGIDVSDRGDMRVSTNLDNHASPDDALASLDERAYEINEGRRDLHADFGMHEDLEDDDTAVIDVESNRVENTVRSVGTATEINGRPAVVAPNLTGHPMAASLDYDDIDEPYSQGPSIIRDGVIIADEPNMGVSIMDRRVFEQNHPEAASAYYADLEQRITGTTAQPHERLASTRDTLHRVGVAPTGDERLQVLTSIHRDNLLYAHGGEKLRQLETCAASVTADDLPDYVSERDVADTVADPRIPTANFPTRDAVLREATQRGARRAFGTISADSLPKSVRPDATETYPGIVESESLGVSVMALSQQRNARIPEEYRTDDGRYYGPAARSVVLRTFSKEASIAGDTRGIEHAIPRTTAEYQRRVDRARSFFE